MSVHSVGWSKRYRTIWISDVHLGTRDCKADLLLQFLRQNNADRIYLVGDIIDGWRIKNGRHWAQSHNDVMQFFLRSASLGTEIIYIPGNHDEMVRPYCDMRLGQIAVLNEAEHVTADGRRLLVIHGDQFDAVVRNAKWLSKIGDAAYILALRLNRWIGWLQRQFGYRYWSISAYLKQVVKDAVEYIGRYEETLVAEARRRGFDGVICGHIHHAQIREIGGIVYYNDGDWVESCTALVEHPDGRIEIVRWVEAGMNPATLVDAAA